MKNFSFFFSRRHPMLAMNEAVWHRISSAYAGGFHYIRTALIRHVSENDLDYAERLQRAYYFNYPRRLAKLITSFIFSVEPARQGADMQIIADWSRSGLSADSVMRQLSVMHDLFGIGWLLVDYPAVNGSPTLQYKLHNRIRPFVRAVDPRHVCDWAFGDDGELEWAIVEEINIRKSSPFDEPVKTIIRRLWTREQWMTFEKSISGEIKLIAQAKHNLGAVPLVMISEPESVGIQANHWFEDIVRISDAILNNESEAQMNIIKQMFGLLVVPEEFVLRGGRVAPTKFSEDDDGRPATLSSVLARSSAVFETQEEKGITRYIHPQGAENAAIRAENIALKREMYDVVGMACQSESREAQTAESKAWDANNVQRFLANRAGLFEQAEQRCWELMHRWDPDVNVPEVAYNRDFAVTELASGVAALLDLSTVEAGEEYQREIARAALDYLDKTHRISPEAFQKISAEIETMRVRQNPLPAQRIPVDVSLSEKPVNNYSGNNQKEHAL